MADYEEWNGIDEMKSMCMSCGEEGLTKIMLHKIPHFRELVISSFNCPHCYERNNDVQFGGEIQLQGCKYELKVKIIIFKNAICAFRFFIITMRLVCIFSNTEISSRPYIDKFIFLMHHKI
jgi:hypothetical protein